MFSFSCKKRKPSETAESVAVLIELIPVFTSDETCRQYSAPIGVLIKLRSESMPLSLRCGINRSLFTTNKIEEV